MKRKIISIDETKCTGCGQCIPDCPEGALETGPAGNPTWNLSSLQRRADATTDRAVEWLSSVEGPFFLWVHYFDPHDAAVLPPEGSLPYVPQRHPLRHTPPCDDSSFCP